MSSLVPKSQIQEIVGVKRDLRKHWGRMITQEQRFYILHPHSCLNSTPNLLDCLYTAALDKGLDEEVWEGFEDRPVVLSIDLLSGLAPEGVECSD